MKFVNDLYWGETARSKQKRILKKIDKGSLLSGVYVVCLPDNGTDPLEYYSVRLLRQDYYKRHDITVVGIAADEDEAVEVVNDILKDCIEKTGTLDVRKFAESLKLSGDEKE